MERQTFIKGSWKLWISLLIISIITVFCYFPKSNNFIYYVLLSYLLGNVFILLLDFLFSNYKIWNKSPEDLINMWDIKRTFYISPLLWIIYIVKKVNKWADSNL